MKRTALPTAALLLTLAAGMAPMARAEAESRQTRQEAAEEMRYEVTLRTNLGTIVVALSDATPRHRDQFVRLVDEGAYDGMLFHRVIKDFMIQSGDPQSKTADRSQHLGDGEVGEPIDAEIVYPQLYHKRGALAAARQGDEVNPEHRSSASQFYIVWGKVYKPQELDYIQARMDSTGHAVMTDEVRHTYETLGGTPHLDGDYTVFGEVVKGLDIVDLIELQPTDGNDRPLDDVRIKKAKVTRRPGRK